MIRSFLLAQTLLFGASLASADQLLTGSGLMAHVADPGRPLVQFSTLAAARSATLPPGTEYIYVLGVAAVGDCRPIHLKIVSSDPGVGLRFSLEGGRFGVLLNHDLDPMWFGLSLAANADNRAAFAALSAEINRRGGFSDVYLPPGAAISYRPSAPNLLPGQSVYENVFTLNGAKKVRIFYQGAQITTGANFRPLGTTDKAAYSLLAHFLVDCENIEINQPVTNQPAYSLRDQNGGFSLAWLRGKTSNVAIRGAKMLGGGAVALTADRGEAVATDRVRNVYIDVETFNVEYGVNGRKNLDALRGRVVTHGGARSVFAYNVADWDLDVVSDSGDGFNDVLVKCYADPTDTALQNSTRDITVRYRNEDRVVPAGASYKHAASAFNVSIQQDTIKGAVSGSTENNAACSIRNIKFIVDMKEAVAGTLGPLLTTNKLDKAGANDLTQRGHVVENVSIEGKIQTSGTNGNLTDLFTEIGNTWALETVRNISLHDLTIEGVRPILINGGAIGATLDLSRIYAPNTPFVISPGASLGVISANDVLFSNWASRGTSNAGVVNVSQSYKRMADGLVLQWGNATVAAASTTRVIYLVACTAHGPIPFPTLGAQTQAGQHLDAQPTNSGFVIRNPAGSAASVSWQTICYATE